MGISGSGQSTIAEIAKAYGYEVSGCDLKTGGHDVAHLQGVDILAVTPAVFFQNNDHPEVELARQKNIFMTGQEFMGKYLHKNKFVICVAGTHGKSTTTAMTGNVLTEAKLDPTVFIGASGSRSGKGKYFVTEADEYYENFLNYHPNITILNNIELDHPEYFKTIDNLLETYQKFINQTDILIYNTDSPLIHKLHLPKNSIAYSINEYPKNLILKVPGNHNKTNAMGVIALSKLLKLPKSVYEKALSNFSGIDRRLQELGTVNGITVIDDYGNHPTAFKANINAVKEKHCLPAGRYPNREIWAIIEPHTFSRLRAVLPELAPALKEADHVIISKIFASREADPGDFTGANIAKSVPNSLYIPEFSEIINHVKSNIKSGANLVILVMGSGNSDKLAREILKGVPLRS